MQIRVFIYILIFCLGNVLGQNKQLLYGLRESPQALLSNPGEIVAQKFHFGIPLLSHIHLNAGSSGVTVSDIFGKSTVDINTRIRNKIFELSEKDFFTITQQLEILNFGWRSKNELYFSGGFYQEFDAIVYFPKDLAILASEGNSNFLNKDFDLGHLSTRGDLLTVYHFGVNKKVNKKLVVGGRAKLYSSIFGFRSTNNKGVFTTRLGGGLQTQNIFEHTLQEIDVSLETSGISNLEELTPEALVKRGVLGGNLGLGFDVGFTYEKDDRWSFSGSLLDVGAIFHTKEVESYRAKGSYTFNGVELVFPGLTDNQTPIEFLDNLETEFENEIPIDTINSGYISLRPLKVNAAVRYGVGKFAGGRKCDCLNQGIQRVQAVGVQYYSIFRPRGPQMALTLFYERNLFRFLKAKATYTADSYTFVNLGFGAVADIGAFNFFIAADNLLGYDNLANSKSVSLQLGFNIKVDQR